ncbi:MAG: DNA polymerase III subunit gamma/tau [Calditrichaeota bacterium]|nr:DNA polymerase III subunit gamma/tau [Calditrichota bacterium]MCB0290780.1 DNA polymerase III subunit gamma/tau [Calditrichota bacterium]MCB0302146.1 DNA polymerase III subunit gamma/tau [Calditrichota bacterium]MCB9090530.1 DNA polymerase III subunit gamma/tau [Calditrichia bacterium]
MSYVVLARKWRPMNFEDMVGQDHVTRTLVNALKQDRLGHAFIFAGPRGVGKTTTARLLAKAVNNKDKPDFGLTDSVAEMEHQKLDVIEIDGASNRGIDEIRNLRESVRIAPASSDFKVYIIDEFHMLSKEAFNALLKTLEEPPSHVLFIFATTEIHKVPLTILSRCQRFDFKRIPTLQIADQLEKIAKSEKIHIDRESLLSIARKAEGGMRDAISIMDQIVSFSDGEITLAQVQQSLGLISDELYFEFTDLMLDRDDGKIIAFAQNIFQQGHDLMNFLHGLEAHFRNLMITRATDSANLLEASDYIKNLYLEKAGGFETRDLLHYLDLLTQHEQMLKFSENPQLVLELLLLKLAHKPLSTDLDTLLNMLNNMPSGPASPEAPEAGPGPVSSPPAGGSRPGGKTGGAPPSRTSPTPAPAGPTGKEPPKNMFAALKKTPFPEASATTPAVEAAPPVPETDGSKSAEIAVTLEEIAAKWRQVIAAVKSEKIALASFLQDGVPYQLNGQVLQIAFDPKTTFHMDHVKKNAPIIEGVLRNTLKAPLKIDCVKVAFTEAGIERQVLSPEEVFESMKDKEPVLKKIIELFDCENMD